VDVRTSNATTSAAGTQGIQHSGAASSEPGGVIEAGEATKLASSRRGDKAPVSTSASAAVKGSGAGNGSSAAAGVDDPVDVVPALSALAEGLDAPTASDNSHEKVANHASEVRSARGADGKNEQIENAGFDNGAGASLGASTRSIPGVGLGDDASAPSSSTTSGSTKNCQDGVDDTSSNNHKDAAMGPVFSDGGKEPRRPTSASSTGAATAAPTPTLKATPSASQAASTSAEAPAPSAEEAAKARAREEVNARIAEEKRRVAESLRADRSKIEAQKAELETMMLEAKAAEQRAEAAAQAAAEEEASRKLLESKRREEERARVEREEDGAEATRREERRAAQAAQAESARSEARQESEEAASRARDGQAAAATEAKLQEERHLPQKERAPPPDAASRAEANSSSAASAVEAAAKEPAPEAEQETADEAMRLAEEQSRPPSDPEDERAKLTLELAAASKVDSEPVTSAGDLEARLEAQRLEMQEMMRLERVKFEQERRDIEARLAEERRLKENALNQKMREEKERRDKIELERRRKLEAQREAKEQLAKQERAALQKQRQEQQAMLDSLRLQREEYEKQKDSLLQVTEPAAGASTIQVTMKDEDGKIYKMALDKESVNQGALNNSAMTGTRQKVGDEVEAMRARLKAEREKLKLELETKRRALQQAKMRTGFDLAEEEARAQEERRREEAEAAREEERRRRREAESSKMLLSEKRAMEAQLQAERARVELEMQKLQLELEKAKSSVPNSPMDHGGSSRGFVPPPAPEPVESHFSQMRAALDAERAAASATLEAQRFRQEELMRRESANLVAKIEKEKAALKAKLASGKPGVESEIQETMKMFQAQLKQQQEQLAGIGVGGPLDPLSAQLATAMEPLQPMDFGNSITPVNPFMPTSAGQMTAAQTPSEEEIRDYAVYLGMNPAEDAHLFYIAEWALTVPLPDGWTEHNDNQGNEFYFNAMTGVSTYEHPLDEHYRSYYRQIKKEQSR